MASAQRGRISRRQLETIGVTPGVISRLVRSGGLHRLAPGVYAVGHSTEVELGAETVALLGSRDGAVLSHQSAAALWKIRPRQEGAVDVLLPVGRGQRRCGINCHRTRRLSSADIWIHEGLAVTSPARTLIDLADILPRRDLERALDQALILKLVTRGIVKRTLAHLTGRRGTSSLAALLDDRRPTARTRSEAEERFLTLIRAAGLPPPEVNARLHGYEVDFLWRTHGVVVEIDGYWYHSTRSAFERDHRKDAVLRRAKLSVARFSRDQVMDEPLAVIADVARSLAEPSAPPPAPRSAAAAAVTPP